MHNKWEPPVADSAHQVVHIRLKNKQGDSADIGIGHHVVSQHAEVHIPALKLALQK